MDQLSVHNKTTSNQLDASLNVSRTEQKCPFVCREINRTCKRALKKLQQSKWNVINARELVATTKKLVFESDL